MRFGILLELSEILSMFRCGKAGAGCGFSLRAASYPYATFEISFEPIIQRSDGTFSKLAFKAAFAA